MKVQLLSAAVLLISSQVATASTVTQLCYQPQNDIHDGMIIKSASHFKESLLNAQSSYKEVCFKLNTKAKQEEAASLIASDPTKSTLIIK